MATTRRARVRDWLGSWFGRAPRPVLDPGEDVVASIEHAREAASRAAAEARARDLDPNRRENLTPLSYDADFDGYRRIAGGRRAQTRDLTPIEHDKMIEVCHYLFESNPFARRLVTLSTDLICGDGVRIEAEDPRIQELVNSIWHHPRNRFPQQLGDFRNSLGLNGELILPVGLNPITGVPIFGFLDSYAVQTVDVDPSNIRLPVSLVLKAEGAAPPQRLQIMQRDPVSGRMVGETFFARSGGLPNSRRGRSELLPIADWLDLFDQLVFQELERVKLLGTFVYDLSMKGADEAKILQKRNEFKRPESGSTYVHNENETLSMVSPELHSEERVETAKMIATHVAGSVGFPLTWLGFSDSNLATIQGQNDVLLKTPSAKQRQFGELIQEWLAFGVASAVEKNRVLYRNADLSFKVIMPEIAAKDLVRASATLTQVVAANDTALANKTMSRKAAVAIQAAMIGHLGIDLGSADELLSDIDADVKAAVLDGDEELRRRQRSAQGRRTDNGLDANLDDEETDDEM